MFREDSAARRLEEICKQEDEAYVSLEAEEICAIQITREQVDEIARYYETYPQHTPEFNIIVETGKSAESILSNLHAFMHPDGEPGPELSEFDKKILSFMNVKGIRSYIRENMGTRSVGVRNMF